MKRKVLAIFLLVILVSLQFTSCGTATEDRDNGLKAPMDDFYYTSDSKAEADIDYEMDGMNNAPSESVTGGNSYSDTNDLSNRKIIKTANISFQTKNYDEFMSAINACIASYGGYVERSESHGGGAYQTHYSRNAYITVRIPEKNYNVFMNEVCNLGSVTFKSEDTKDVTIAYVDTESRIKALEAEYDALLAILEKATKLDDVIQLQSRISDVTYQLESYKSQLRKYDDLISYCTVALNITEVYKEVVNEERMTLGERIADGFSVTLLDITDDLEDFSVWFISSIPYIVIWAVVIIAIVFIIKRAVKKHKNKKESKPEKNNEEKDNEKTE